MECKIFIYKIFIYNFSYKFVTFCVIHLVSKNCYILSEKAVTFRVKKLLHFAAKVVTFRVDVTFCIKSCYISG